VCMTIKNLHFYCSPCAFDATLGLL
jgi:hypothetical protein